MTKVLVGIEAMDYMSQLTTEKVFGYSVELRTVDDIIDDLLAFQVQSPAITKGTIATAYSVLERSLDVDSESILQTLLSLRATIGGYLEVDDNRQLNWRESIGEDKGQQIRYRKNLAGITRDVNYTQLINRLYVFGAGEGAARIRLGDYGYAYMGGSTVDKVWKAHKLDLVKDSESADYGSTIYAIVEDGDYIYAGGGGGTIWKIQKSDMSKIAESGNYGAIEELAEDVGYIYAVGGVFKRVRKHLKSDLSYVSQSADYVGWIFALVEDDEYLYIGGSVTRTVWKIRKSDMVKVAESPNFGSEIYALAEDDTYVYAGGTGGRIWRLLKSDMSKVDESGDYGGYIKALAIDGTHIYVGGDGTPLGDPNTIKKLLLSDFSEIAESVETARWTSLTAKVDSYLYACSLVPSWTHKFWKYDMAKIGDGLDYGAPVYAVATESPFEDYLDDAFSQTTWGGIYPNVIIDDLITDADTLMERAIYELSQVGNPPVAYQVNTLDLSAHEGYNFEALKLGSLVTVIDEDLGIDAAVYVSKITHPDLLNPQRMEIELSVLTRDIIDTILEEGGATGISVSGGGVATPAHATTHEDGGTDEISVDNLDGLLIDMQHPHMDDFDWGIIFDFTHWSQIAIGTGTTTRTFRKVVVNTGNVANGVATAYAAWFPDINWDGNMSFYFAFRPSLLEAGTQGYFHMGQLIVGIDPAASTIGFKVIGDALHGLVHDGANLYIIDLGFTLVGGTYYFLEVRLTAGENVKWFVNGVEEGSEPHFPTGAASRTLVISTKNPGTANRMNLLIARWAYKIGWG